jgi:hypothetical protein
MCDAVVAGSAAYRVFSDKDLKAKNIDVYIPSAHLDLFHQGIMNIFGFHETKHVRNIEDSDDGLDMDADGIMEELIWFTNRFKVCRSCIL